MPGTRGNKRKSEVWQFMEQLGPMEVHCLLCGFQFKFHNSTSAMLRHLQAKHSDDDPDEARTKAAASRQYAEPPRFPCARTRSANVKKRKYERKKPLPSKKIKEDFQHDSDEEWVPPSNKATPPTPKKPKALKFDRKSDLDRCVLGWIVSDLQSFSVVEDPAFAELITKLDFKYQLPTQKTLVDTFLPEVYESTKGRVRYELQSAFSIAISTDVWTYCGKQTYLSISGNFISSDWEFRSLMLETVKLPENYTSSTIANEMYKVFENWEIASKVFCITTDTSSDMAAAVGQLNINHQSCYGHSLNVVVQDALKAVPEFEFLKEKVVDVVKFFQGNPNASDTLAALQQVQGKTPLKLKSEVETRWNSTYHMFQRYIDMHTFVCQALKSVGKNDMAITEEDVETMKECVQALEVFDLAVKEFYLEDITSLSKVIPMTRTLTKYLNKGILTGSLAKELGNQMTQRFSNLEGNMFPAAATYLDPRFKKVAFDEENTSTLVQEELKTMMELDSAQSGITSQAETPSTQSKTPQSTSSLWSDFDLRVNSSRSSLDKSMSVPDLEFERYETEVLIPRTENALEWWKSKENIYPGLCKVAKQFLGVPAISVAPEKLFTKQADVDQKKRDSLKESLMNKVLFLSKNNKQV